MTGLCIGSSNGEYTFTFTGDEPEIGHSYILDSAVTGTGAQNRAFHALTMEYWRSGQHSYNADSYADFRNQIKKSLGEGFEGFVYIDIVLIGEDFKESHYKMFDVKKKSDIPEHVLKDPNMKDMIRGKLKSWSDYTMKQRKNTIDNLISEMLQSGINTKKFQEILKGMEDGSQK